MPIPPALASRLSKRGLLAAQNKQAATEKKKVYKGSAGCPNKYNIYHECNFWCDTHWKGVLQPDPKYVRSMQKMLQKYPLPNNWTEVFDKGMYYYWDMEKDRVSWLPPKHPKATPSEPAAKLRAKALNPHETGTKTDEEKEEKRKSSKSKERDEKRHGRSEEKEKNRKKQRKDDVALDPMDPAAYSDVPQGTWSDGLENNKTRADNTASGSLYQQRPYPAPGEVLASNKNNKPKKSPSVST